MFCCSFALLFSVSAQADTVCIILTGLGGMPEYEENFLKWADGLEKICRQELRSHVHRVDGRRQKRADMLEVFTRVSVSNPSGEIWLFLIGHGNDDGFGYKFNISGPDLTEQDLKHFLARIGDRKAYIVAATGASGALIPALSARNRIILTATKNKFERQPPLFLSFFLEAATSAGADTDKNGQVSLLEAFTFSQRQVVLWFEEKGRLQTEHPLLDDNGDGVGTADPNPSAGDGMLAATAYLSAPPERAYRSLEAQQLAQEKLKVEREIEDLKYRKKELPEAAYYQQLETLLVQLAELTARISDLEEKP